MRASPLHNGRPAADGSNPTSLKTTASHWGTYRAEVEDGRLIALHGFEDDVDPSPIGQAQIDTLDDPCRIPRPMVRQGYLEHGPDANRGGRGCEPFVTVSWDHAERLVADELKRVRETHGNEAIYAGCYGWASAGRFHHAKSQLHRFMNCVGGATVSRDTYSFAAGEVILPHVLGNLHKLFGTMTTWPSIIEHTDLLVAFGGLPLKNGQVNSGGAGRHVQRDYMADAARNGLRVVNISPLRTDVEAGIGAEWLAPVPNTDVAIMLGLAHTLVADGREDRAFLERYCVGYERFHAYLTGATDGIEKDAEWAAAISGLDAATLRQLARDMAAGRTMLAIGWALTRQDHGEQNFWMGVVLAAMLGQIGLPGGGIGFGYSATNGIGGHMGQMHWAALEQGSNPVETYIPVARIADLLLNPGAQVDYNGKRLTYPDIKLVYWAGGNPFHHHQDLNRLVRAWQRPETIIVHEPWWTATARHADIVLPATTTLERNDLAASARDPYLVAMQQAVEPYGEARNDYDIFRGIARELDVEESFTAEGRDESEWLRHLYEISRQRATASEIEMPPFEEFWAAGAFKVEAPPVPTVMLDAFRRDPESNPLPTPSGRIEVFSDTIDAFGYDDCPGHPVWMEPAEWLNHAKVHAFPLHLVSNQPITRLHSQLDNSAYSRSREVNGREAIVIHPDDAAARDIRNGDVVRVFNDRGECLAGAVVSDAVRASVVQMPTGAWFDPETPGQSRTRCKHGNPNVLTPDKGSSKLAQGPSALSCLVEVARYDGEPPAVTAFEPPVVISD